MGLLTYHVRCILVRVSEIMFRLTSGQLFEDHKLSHYACPIPGKDPF